MERAIVRSRGRGEVLNSCDAADAYAARDVDGDPGYLIARLVPTEERGPHDLSPGVELRHPAVPGGRLPRGSTERPRCRGEVEGARAADNVCVALPVHRQPHPPV